MIENTNGTSNTLLFDNEAAKDFMAKTRHLVNPSDTMRIWNALQESGDHVGITKRMVVYHIKGQPKPALNKVVYPQAINPAIYAPYVELMNRRIAIINKMQTPVTLPTK